MKTNLTPFITVLATALFGGGCASTVITKAQLQNGLVAYLPFNGNAKDASENHYDGKVKGAILTTDRHGEAKNAYSFKGRQSIHVNGIEFDGRYTLSVWFKSKSPLSMMVLHMKVPPSRRNSHAFIQHNNLSEGGHPNGIRAVDRIPAGESGGSQVYSNKNLHDDSWHHATAVKSVSKFSLYIDGSVVSEMKDETKRRFVVADLYIGENIGNNYYDGSIDDVRIYNRALSASEVKALYDLEKPKSK